MVRERAKREGKRPQEVFFTRRDVREYTGWSHWQVKTHIRQLEELEYLQVRARINGRRYSYALTGDADVAETNEGTFRLTSAEEIKRRLKLQ